MGNSLNQITKLKAKRIALGKEEINDIEFLKLLAIDRNELSVTVRATTVSLTWEPIVLSICKINLRPDQMDIEKKFCTLLQEQMDIVKSTIADKIEASEMRPHAELFVRTARGKMALISNQVDLISNLENGENARRWGDYL